MGVKVSGCTVHFADDTYDTGPIILQRTVPVLEDDTAETLAARVFREECRPSPRPSSSTPPAGSGSKAAAVRYLAAAVEDDRRGPFFHAECRRHDGQGFLLTRSSRIVWRRPGSTRTLGSDSSASLGPVRILAAWRRLAGRSARGYSRGTCGPGVGNRASALDGIGAACSSPRLCNARPMAASTSGR